MKNSLLFSLLVVVISFGFIACNKDKEDEPISTPGNSNFFVSVLLNPEYAPAEKVDSAFISWEQDGKQDSVKFEVLNGDLKVPFSLLPQQEKSFRISLLTSIKIGQRKLLWEKKFTTSLAQKNALNIAAPFDINDVNWLPRVILNDQSGLVAFSGLRPADPFFHIHKIGKEWHSITVDRSYWNTVGGVQKVAGAIWQGNNVLNPGGSYTNESFFSSFPAKIGTTAWNHLELIMLFATADNSQMRVLDFYHDMK